MGYKIEENCTMDKILLEGNFAFIQEGLIRTYPLKDVCQAISGLFGLSMDKSLRDEILNGKTYYNGYLSVLQALNNEQQILTIVPDKDENRDRMAKYFNKYGYFVAAEESNYPWRKIWWEKKFGVDATEEVRRYGCLYHLCSSNIYSKIQKQGLTPRSSQWGKDFQNPERIYFFLKNLSHITFEGWARDFKRGKNLNTNNFLLLKIDVSKLSFSMRFYADSRMPKAVYSLEGVPPQAITVIDAVDVKD